MTAPILYCGDTSLETAASYLAGVITHSGWEFDYVPSHVKVSRDIIDQPRSLLILSDYPAQQFAPELQQLVIEQIDRGMGLLMIGGWESFHGLGGDWDQAPLAGLLPVEISAEDDRVNFDQPALLHPADWRDEKVFGLPWSQRPPTVGGLNRFIAKPNAYVWLNVTPYQPRYDRDIGAIQWVTTGESIPALVASARDRGRVAAFASDVAPHWVGGFVDWGATRVTAQAPGAGAIEVGSDYAQFWKQLLAWTGQLD
jgi:uncharacterized membrane protein